MQFWFYDCRHFVDKINIMKEDEFSSENSYEIYLVLFEELEELLEYTPPRVWRKNIEHLFFNFLEENETFQSSDYQELIGQMIRLINFFDTAEELIRK